MTRFGLRGFVFVVVLLFGTSSMASEALKRESWASEFAAARTKVEMARERSEDATRNYKRMRHRKRIRGEPRERLVAELAAATAAVPVAEAELEALVERARRAGVPVGWMRAEMNAAPASDPAN